MLRHFTLGSALMVGIGLPAQLHIAPRAADAENKHAGTAVPSIPTPLGAAKGSAYYTETFDTGMGAWTVQSGVGNLDWIWTNTGPGPTSSTYPVPPLLTSTPSGWMIIDDDYSGQPGVEAESSIVSPVIDLSSAPVNLKVEFDQYFQEFVNAAVACWVGVTVDGGFTWNEVNINEGVGRDGRPNPELVDVDISAWVALDPTNVQLRFRYIATWDYGWQIDNVYIRELPMNDMALLGVKQTDFNFDLNGLANIEYSVYPQEQTREMIMQGAVKNKGYLAQSGVQLSVAVGGAGSGTQVSVPYDAISGQVDTVSVAGYTPGALGTYTLDFTVDQNEADDVPANNTGTSGFQVDACQWAQDDGIAQNKFRPLGVNLEEPYALGNYFDVANSGSTLYGIAVAIDDSTLVGTPIYGSVLDINDAEVAHTVQDYDVQAADLNGPGDANWILLPVQTPITLDAGTAYLVLVGGYGGSDQLHISTSGTSAAQVSIVHYPNSAPPEDFFYVTRTPMVRALLGSSCAGLGVQDAMANGLELEANVPNPFIGTTTVSFTLAQAASVRIEVRDLEGRTVRTLDLGRRSAGRHTQVLDATGLAAGSYTLTLAAGQQRITRSMVVGR